MICNSLITLNKIPVVLTSKEKYMMDSEQTIPKEKFREENINAEVAINQNEFQTAARILVSIVEKDSQNWRAYNNMGVLSWERKFWNDAYLMFKKAVEINPVYADALMNLFDAALKLKKVDEVFPLFENALEIEPDLEEIRVVRDAIAEQGDKIYTSIRAQSVGIYSPIIEEAEKFLEDGDLISAMKKFLEANDTEGPTDAAFSGLATISFRQERYRDAVSLFVESIKINPSNTETYKKMLEAAKMCDMVEIAKHVYESFKEEYPILENISDTFDELDIDSSPDVNCLDQDLQN